MNYMRRRIMAALTGACTALLIFGTAFAVTAPISAENERQASDIHKIVDEITDEEMNALLEYMDEKTVESIKEKLVDDANNDIIYAYLQTHPEFEDILMDYLNN